MTIATTDSLNVAIASAMGLPTKNLVGATLTLAPGQLPTVVATYHLLDDMPLCEVLGQLKLAPTKD